MPTYTRADLAFEHGEGAWLWAADGKRYLDFAGGVAVNSLGHAHPKREYYLQSARDNRLFELTDSRNEQQLPVFFEIENAEWKCVGRQNCVAPRSRARAGRARSRVDSWSSRRRPAWCCCRAG